MKVILLSLLSITLLYSCKKKEAPLKVDSSCSSYITSKKSKYPITVGSYWVYDLYKVIDTTGYEYLVEENIISQILKDTLINDKTYSILKKNKFVIPNSPSGDVYLRDSSGYIVELYRGRTYGDWEFSDSLNTSIEYVDSVTGNVSYNIITWLSYKNQNINVSVPAGDFIAKKQSYNAERANGNQFSACIQESFIHDFAMSYYSENVGLIKENSGYTNSLGCFHYEKRLKSYYIAD